MIDKSKPIEFIKPELKDDGTLADVEIMIPQCCSENWASCPHCAKKQRKVKRNIGL